MIPEGRGACEGACARDLKVRDGCLQRFEESGGGVAVRSLGGLAAQGKI